MGKVEYPKPVKLIFSILSSDVDLFCEAESLLVSHYGNIDMVSEFQPFDYTNYYQSEMGDNLKQKIFSFETLLSPDQISIIKLNSNKWEWSLSEGGGDEINGQTFEKKRKVNLDPGYISLNKFILASTKDGPARIYLKEGIYAEITLSYINGSFQAHRWTYQNYQSDLYINFLNRVREHYRIQLKSFNG